MDSKSSTMGQKLGRLWRKTPMWRLARRIEHRSMEVVGQLTRITNDGSYQAHHDVSLKTREEPVGTRKGGLKGG